MKPWLKYELTKLLLSYTGRLCFIWWRPYFMKDEGFEPKFLYNNQQEPIEL